MRKNEQKNISQCQIDLARYGFCLSKIELPSSLLEEVNAKDYSLIDKTFHGLTSKDGLLYQYLQNFCEFTEIEFIISLRSSKNEWEEDGIWHDDGSRKLAFSLSLTLEMPVGGVLEFRKKGETESQKIETPNYSEIIIFKTGVDNYEHKINKVENGERLIIAGWCS